MLYFTALISFSQKSSVISYGPYFLNLQKVGKFSIEFAQIGLMLGTCIAFYIVISSLLVEVFADIIQSEPTLDSREELRRQFCLFLGFFIVLPLGLLRNMSSIGKF